ncbi:adhesion G protein-coupled receptor A1 isoform X2 [Kryptolebias marmoratus]|uniref:adhesion G protein-coupled receptor A1 isoform X2 n=1 Tax=Kryptolebias marmoratus TaxID=37003 RepID=UPI0007F8F983|nr:adhesion G protein-coupled receptor A1 isoform X2 [Kryptolebias marmoratus]
MDLRTNRIKDLYPLHRSAGSEAGHLHQASKLKIDSTKAHGFKESFVLPPVPWRLLTSGGVCLHCGHAALSACLHCDLHCTPQVGILLHYASLSTMLWLMFIARNICKDVSKDPLQAQDRNGLAQMRTKPTILRFYLVSDGIPIIIVGVTAAFDLENYGSKDDALYCWMAWEPSLGSFYAPVGLLILVMFMYFLYTYIQLKRHPERRYELHVLSEDQQQLSSTDEHCHCAPGRGGAAGNAGDCPAFSAGVSVLANEHSFKSQLRATAFTLFLFLATWVLGGLAVSLGHFLDMIFSCLYGAFCVTLGLFLLIQHCAKRDDVWNRWWICCPSKAKTQDGNIKSQSQTQEPHQPHCHLSSPCSGKQPLLSSHLLQSSCDKMTPPPLSPNENNTGPCCVAVMSSASPISPKTEPVPSPHPHTLPDELPNPILPLQSCLTDRKKSCSFNHPRPCLKDYRSHMTSSSMDGSVLSSHLGSQQAAHHPKEPSLVSNNPDTDFQLPCASPHLDKQMASCYALQRQTSCYSVQDAMTSYHSHTHNMPDTLTSCHSLLMPSQGVHSCQWHMHGSSSPSNTACCEKSDSLTLQYQQDSNLYSCISTTEDKEKHNHSLKLKQRGFPRNTLPRQHATVSHRRAIGRNRSLQEDGLVGSDVTGNIRTGLWKNETTV